MKAIRVDLGKGFTTVRTRTDFDWLKERKQAHACGRFFLAIPMI